MGSMIGIAIGAYAMGYYASTYVYNIGLRQLQKNHYKMKQDFNTAIREIQASEILRTSFIDGDN